MTLLSDAWKDEEQAAKPEPRSTSHASLRSTASRHRTPIFAKHTARVTPNLETRDSIEQDDVGKGGRTPDTSVFTRESTQPSLVSIEEATGEIIGPEVLVPCNAQAHIWYP